MAAQADTAIANPALGIEFNIAAHMASASQQPHLAVAQVAVVGGEVWNACVIEAQLRAHALAQLAQATVTGECQCQVAPIEQRGTLGAACTRIERGKLHCQYGVRRRPGLQLPMGAGRSLHVHAGHFGHRPRRRNIDAAASGQLAVLQAQVGAQHATALQLEPGFLHEQCGNPVERGEGPFALGRSGGAAQHLAGFGKWNVSPGDGQIRVQRSACALALRQPRLQADIAGGVQLHCQRSAVGGASSHLQGNAPDRMAAGLKRALVQGDRGL
ncbi:hypothetical protein D3C71_789140 [compost metagenome]